MSDSALIKIRDLRFKRGKRFIFDGVDIDIEEGKITAIMGPSGTGKTTLLKLIGAELYPDSGKIWIDNKNIHALKQKELYEVRKTMGLLFQTAALFTNLSVFDNVAFPLREHTKLDKRLIRDIVLMKLQAVGLRGAHNLMPSQLSGGMARRVALARAIALDPRVIMYDEPFTGQDPITMGVLVKLIKQLNQLLGMTSIIVSHDVPETCAIADYVYLLAGGKVLAQGKPKELIVSQNPQVKQFMQGLPDGSVPFHYPANDYLEDLLDA